MSTTTDQLENDIMAIDIRLNELRRIRELKVQELKDAAILEQIKQQVSPAIFKQIQNNIVESGYTYDYEIVDTPKGDFQDRSNEYDDYFLNMWVDQYSGFGDDFHGTVDIELSEGKYLRWSFSM